MIWKDSRIGAIRSSSHRTQGVPYSGPHRTWIPSSSLPEHRNYPPAAHTQNTGGTLQQHHRTQGVPYSGPHRTQGVLYSSLTEHREEEEEDEERREGSDEREAREGIEGRREGMMCGWEGK